jgi:protein-disulfide isomerase
VCDRRLARHRVDEDISCATELDISGTPTFFANGKRLLGLNNRDQLNTLLSSVLQEWMMPLGIRR